MKITFSLTFRDSNDIIIETAYLCKIMKKEAIAVPRTAREKSKTGIYAILIKGSDSERKIFFDDEDYNEFIMRLDEYMDTAIMAFALCEKTICLIAKEDENGIGRDIKSITTSYARYYGGKYGSKGGIFEHRFRSVPIETPEELAKELACVHRFCDYTESDGYTGRYIDDELLITDEAMELLGDRNLYDEAMKAENPITYFYSQIFVARRTYNSNPRAGESKQQKRTEIKNAKKQTVEKKPKTTSVQPRTVKSEKEPEPELPKIKEEPKQEIKKKKKNMPSWLL